MKKINRLSAHREELKKFLASLELLADSWGLIKHEKYGHRTRSYREVEELDQAALHIPRKIGHLEIFSIKTMLLTKSRFFMEANNKDKVFVG